MEAANLHVLKVSIVSMFEEHETSIILKACEAELGGGYGNTTKGFDGVYVKLFDFHFRTSNPYTQEAVEYLWS